MNVYLWWKCKKKGSDKRLCVLSTTPLYTPKYWEGRGGGLIVELVRYQPPSKKHRICAWQLYIRTKSSCVRTEAVDIYEVLLSSWVKAVVMCFIGWIVIVIVIILVVDWHINWTLRWSCELWTRWQYNLLVITMSENKSNSNRVLSFSLSMTVHMCERGRERERLWSNTHIACTWPVNSPDFCADRR